jgi:hypothetical protein
VCTAISAITLSAQVHTEAASSPVIYDATATTSGSSTLINHRTDRADWGNWRDGTRRAARPSGADRADDTTNCTAEVVSGD